MNRAILPIIVLFSTLSAASVLPSSPNGQMVQEYLDAFNSGEPAMRAYYQAHPSGPPVEERLERYRKTKADFGSLTALRLVRDEPGSLEVVVSTADRRELNITFMIGGEKPEIRGLRFVAGGGPGEGMPPAPAPQGGSSDGPNDEKSILHRIQDLAGAKSKAGEFSGTVLIARGADVLWQGVYGLANREKNIPIQLDTRFDVGSIAKAFTRVAIGQLMEQGKLKLTDKVGQFLPDYPNATVREQVTIQQLLEMRSGIGDFFGEKLQKANRQNIRTLRDYLPLFANDPLWFAPGTSERYSNGGYIVLGLIIESVTGESYYDYVRKNVFERAGMKDSSFAIRTADDPKRAVGYTSEAAPGSTSKTLHPNLEILPARGSSAGSAQCTAVDLLQFAQALADGKLLSRDSLEKVDLHPFGMGIAGGAVGINASLDTGVESAGQVTYSVVVLSNLDPPSAERLSEEIRNQLSHVK